MIDKSEIDFKVLQTLNILYVEDEVGIQEEMEINIGDFFKSFIIADDGIDGIAKFKENDIDIVITDIKMPNLDGLSMMERLQDVKKTPFILTTAFKEIEYLQKAIDIGADGYISKPINAKNLLKIVSKASNKIVKERLELELKDINKNLQTLVDEKVDEILLKDNLIKRQSKYALMGEMLDAITHQFKTPLSIINMLAFNISREFLQESDMSLDNLDRVSTKIQKQIDHLNNTILEFKGFFRDDKKIESFYIDDLLETTIALIEDEIKKENIKIYKKIEKNIKIKGYFNEFTHIILNLLQNSKDAFIEKNIEDRDIFIEAYEDKIIFRDSAKGISKNLLNKIFDLNFTTKSQGSGLGLYICKIILEKIDAEIEAKNIDDFGLEFKITLKNLED